VINAPEYKISENINLVITSPCTKSQPFIKWCWWTSKHQTYIPGKWIIWQKAPSM